MVLVTAHQLATIFGILGMRLDESIPFTYHISSVDSLFLIILLMLLFVLDNRKHRLLHGVLVSIVRTQFHDFHFLMLG